MEDLRKYIRGIIEPTVAEFAQHPASVRHGFLACVVIFHAVDYLAYPDKPRGLRQTWCRQSADFDLIDKVAHAFKHVESSKGLNAKQVTSRPPSIPGLMVPGVSVVGDPVGAVLVEGKDLFQVVRRAVEFIRQQASPESTGR